MKPAKQSQYIKLIILSLTGVVVFLSFFMFWEAFRYDKEYGAEEAFLSPIAIEGEYSEEGGPWKPFTPETDFDNLFFRDITLRGHFTQDIPKGENLYLKLDHMWVALEVNGEEIYSLIPTREDGNPTQAMGRQWVSVISPGITTKDMVELNFGNLYWNAYMIQFDELLRHMYIGDEAAMRQQAVSDDGMLLGIGLLLFSIAVPMFIIALMCGFMKIKDGVQFAYLGMMALSTSCWMATLAASLSFFLPRPVFLNIAYAYSIQGIIIFATLFAGVYVSQWRKDVLQATVAALLFMLAVDVARQMKGIQDLYDAIVHFSVLDIAVAGIVLFCLQREYTTRKSKEIMNLWKAFCPLFLFGVLELVNGYFQFAEATICFGIGLFCFAMIEGVYILRRIRQGMEMEKRALKLEHELAESRIAIMLSQIKPHFLYNSLTAISQLCDRNPALAKEATIEFSQYLRENLESMNQRKVILFREELLHTKHYLWLEKMRFGDKLNIEYEIETESFSLPPLTLQPIVENAVKHGLSKKPGGGTVMIRTCEKESCYEITVMDDGIGYEEEKSRENTHLGIENVRARLEAMCNATITIKRQQTGGTEAVIRIPKGEWKDAHDSSR